MNLQKLLKTKIECYDDYDKSLSKLSKKEKGIIHEQLSKYYFVLNYRDTFKEIYLYDEISYKLKKKLNLPAKDKGIDLVLKDKLGDYYAVQVKWRHNRKTIPFGELATFPALTFGTNVKGFKKGIMFTNCIDICEELKNDKYLNITYRDLNKHCDKQFFENITRIFADKKVEKNKMVPLKHQKIPLLQMSLYYQKNNIGILLLACGTGKTFLGYWHCVIDMKYKKICIIVPSLYLLSGTFFTWTNEIDKKYKFTLIGSDLDKNGESNYLLTTDEESIEKRLKKYKYHVVITTYQSSELLLNCCKKIDYKFNCAIFDEAHRSAGRCDKMFTYLLSSKYDFSENKLFMTATKKVHDNIHTKLSDDEIDNVLLSMDNKKVYGDTIYEYNTRNAIEDNVLVDYNVVAPFINKNDKLYDLIDDNKIINVLNEKYEAKFIFLCIVILKSMEICNYTHLLIFSNRNEKAKKIAEILKVLQSKTYIKYLSGNDNMNIRKYEVTLFEKEEKAIISSARIFGEGVDIRKCDAVCFVDNKNSVIDIIQCVGRCLRKDPLNKSKIGHVIIPFIMSEEEDLFSSENESFYKLRKIIRALGTSDEMISDKFLLKNCGSKKVCGIKDDKFEYIEEAEIAEKIRLKELRDNILTKVFNRKGELESKEKHTVINKNIKRYNNDKLIYCSDREVNDKLGKTIKSNIDNKVRFYAGIKLWKIIKEKYIYDVFEFEKICEKMKIYDKDTYKNRRKEDKRLPPYKYINNGFYNDLDPKFNLTTLLEKNEYDCDY